MAEAIKKPRCQGQEGCIVRGLNTLAIGSPLKLGSMKLEVGLMG